MDRPKVGSSPDVLKSGFVVFSQVRSESSARYFRAVRHEPSSLERPSAIRTRELGHVAGVGAYFEVAAAALKSEDAMKMRENIVKFDKVMTELSTRYWLKRKNLKGFEGL